MQWYYIKNDERFGPVEEDELRAMITDGRLRPDDLIWNETMGEDWAEVHAIPSLSVQPSAHPPDEIHTEAEAGQPETAMPPPLDPRDNEEKIYGGPISCTDPVARAWKRMVVVLFSPFDFGKWFALGLSAWLASFLNRSGSGSGNYRYLQNMNFEDIIETAQNWMNEYGGIIAIVTAVVAVLFISFGLLFLWLRSRGTFMFLENVTHNRAEVGEPWHKNKRLGNSLFRWNIVFSLACLLITLILAAAAIFAILLPCVRIEGFDPASLPAIIILGMIWLLFGIVAAVIRCFRDDFVAPIMYRLDMTCTAAWGHFLGIMRPQFGTFFVYLLFRLLLTMGAQAALGLITVITCCIAGFILAIPYIGAVAALPIHVFFRAYSLEYLAQFGKEYRLFAW